MKEEIDREIWVVENEEFLAEWKLKWTYMDKRYQIAQKLHGYYRLEHGDDNEITKQGEKMLSNMSRDLTEMSVKINEIEEWLVKSARYHDMMDHGTIEEAIDMYKEILLEDPSVPLEFRRQLKKAAKKWEEE